MTLLMMIAAIRSLMCLQIAIPLRLRHTIQAYAFSVMLLVTPFYLTLTNIFINATF